MIELYPSCAYDIYHRRQPKFTSSTDAICQEIHKACEGLGTDNKALIKLIGGRTLNERNLIAMRYKELFKKTLQSLIASETSSDFGYVLTLLTLPLPQAEALILRKAVEGVGTDEDLIYPVIMGRTNEEMDMLKKVYFDTYNTDLAVSMEADLDGEFKQTIMSALQSPTVEYKSSFHTLIKAESDAENLYNAGEGKWGTDETSFIKIILSSPAQHLKNINDVYQQKYKNTLVEAIENEFTDCAAKALIFHVRANLNAIDLVTDCIEESMKFIGTNEKALSCALVRYQSALERVASHYHQKYKKTLVQRIKEETSGDFQDLLIKVVEAASSDACSA